MEDKSTPNKIFVKTLFFYSFLLPVATRDRVSGKGEDVHLNFMISITSLASCSDASSLSSSLALACAGREVTSQEAEFSVETWNIYHNGVFSTEACNHRNDIEELLIL